MDTISIKQRKPSKARQALVEYRVHSAAGILPMGNPFSLNRTLSIQQQLDTPSSAYIDIVDNLLMASERNTRQRWILTAARRGDGVTATAIGLAHTLGALNKSTLLVDANFHDAALSGDLSGPGLLQLLQGECAIENALIQGDDSRSFSILPAGSGMEKPLLLMDNDRLKSCMETLSNAFDFVLIDTPAFDSSLDAQLMIPHVEGCIVVVRAEKTGKHVLLKIQQKVEKAGGKILGFVFNRESRLIHNIAKRWL